tara:strand:+ start:170 stop:1156 length:987 start_codon:yes stop_codon:yes gene_type:complete
MNKNQTQNSEYRPQLVVVNLDKWKQKQRKKKRQKTLNSIKQGLSISLKALKLTMLGTISAATIIGLYAYMTEAPIQEIINNINKNKTTISVQSIQLTLKPINIQIPISKKEKPYNRKNFYYNGSKITNTIIDQQNIEITLLKKNKISELEEKVLEAIPGPYYDPRTRLIIGDMVINGERQKDTIPIDKNRAQFAITQDNKVYFGYNLQDKYKLQQENISILYTCGPWIIKDYKKNLKISISKEQIPIPLANAKRDRCAIVEFEPNETGEPKIGLIVTKGKGMTLNGFEIFLSNYSCEEGRIKNAMNNDGGSSLSKEIEIPIYLAAILN